MPVDVVCANCRTEFTVTPARHENNTTGNFYCSNDCQHSHMTGDEHPRWNDNLHFECEYCGEEFRGKTGDPNKYCSHECAGQDKPLKDRVSDEKWEQIKKQSIERFTGETNPMKNEEIKKKVIKNMTETRKEQGSPWNNGEGNGMYNVTGSDNPAWRGGGERYYGENWTEMRRQVRERDSYTCQNCGTKEEAINRELDVHHIKPRREFENVDDSNTMDNLITLCMSCHRSVEWGDLEVNND